MNENKLSGYYVRLEESSGHEWKQTEWLFCQGGRVQDMNEIKLSGYSVRVEESSGHEWKQTEWLWCQGKRVQDMNENKLRGYDVRVEESSGHEWKQTEQQLGQYKMIAYMSALLSWYEDCWLGDCVCFSCHGNERQEMSVLLLNNFLSL